MQKTLATLGRHAAATPQGERRRALNEENKKARARFYEGERKLDALQRECTASCQDLPPEQWDAALDKYEAELAVFVKAAANLPAGAKG